MRHSQLLHFMSRPFVSLSIDRLEALETDYANEPITLHKVLDEVRRRSSQRAQKLRDRLERKLATTQAPSRLAPSLLGSKAQPTKPVVTPDSNVAFQIRRQSKAAVPASQLLKRQTDLQSTIQKADASLIPLEAEFQRLTTTRAILRNEREKFIDALLPGYSLPAATLPPKIASLRENEIKLLLEEAIRRWPRTADMENIEAAIRSATESITNCRLQLSEAKRELAEVTDFINRNRGSIENELENDLVSEVAILMQSHSDQFELLRLIRERGYADALSILARARLNLQNVIQSGHS